MNDIIQRKLCSKIYWRDSRAEKFDVKGLNAKRLILRGLLPFETPKIHFSRAF